MDTSGPVPEGRPLEAPDVLRRRLYAYGLQPPNVLQQRSDGARPSLATYASAVSSESACAGGLGAQGTVPSLGAGAEPEPQEGVPIPYLQLKRAAARKERERARIAAKYPRREVAMASAPASEERAAEESTNRQDPFWFIDMLRTELANNEFAYMNVADAEGLSLDPYNLKIVPFHSVNRDNHYTISEAGVTHCFRKKGQEHAEFTPLEQWENECHLFHELMAIPFFKRCDSSAQRGGGGGRGGLGSPALATSPGPGLARSRRYHAWKTYYVWKRNIQADKMSICKQVLSADLFMLNAVFQPALMRVRELCVTVSGLRLHSVEPGRTYRLEEFEQAQAAHKVETCARLEGFSDAVRQVV